MLLVQARGTTRLNPRRREVLTGFRRHAVGTRLASVSLSVVMTGATSVALLTGTAAPAAADPTVTQQAVLIKDKSPYKLTYHEHIDGIGQGDEVCYFGAGDGCAKYPPNAGKVNYSVKMYRLKERERRYDYYFVDVTANTYARKGDGDKGRMSITLDPTSKVNLTTNVYSKNTLKDDCHTYPLEIGVGLGPFSAGTTVANFSTCDKADIHTTKLASNAVRYDIYSLNRFRNWTVQKWVRVAKGAKPRFKVTVRWRADNCTVLRRDVKAFANVKTKTKVIKIRAPR